MIRINTSLYKAVLLLFPSIVSVFTSGCRHKVESTETESTITGGEKLTDITACLAEKNEIILSAVFGGDGCIWSILETKGGSEYRLAVYDPKSHRSRTAKSFHYLEAAPEIIGSDRIAVNSPAEESFYIFEADKITQVINYTGYDIDDPVYSAYTDSFFWTDKTSGAVLSLSSSGDTPLSLPCRLPYYGDLQMKFGSSNGAFVIEATDLRNSSKQELLVSPNGDIISEGEGRVCSLFNGDSFRYYYDESSLHISYREHVCILPLSGKAEVLSSGNAFVLLSGHGKQTESVIISEDDKGLFIIRQQLDSVGADILPVGIKNSGTDGYTLLLKSDSSFFLTEVYADHQYLILSETEDRDIPASISIDPCLAYKPAIESKYGISILIGSDAVLDFPDYTVDCIEDQEMILEALSQIDSALSRYPDNYFSNLQEGICRGIVLCLTGKMYTKNLINIDNPDAFAVLDHHLQFIAINIDSASDISRVLFHELTHATDKKIAAAANSGSSNFNERKWNTLNPDGFEYYYSYLDSSGISYAISGSLTYTSLSQDCEKGAVYFVDCYAKTFPSEDRARLMEMIMMENELPPYFYEEPVRNKLEYYFSAIREVFGSSWTEAPYWERVLSRIAA